MKAAESFLAILQEALSDQIFIVDYQRLHPVVNDIEILQQACPELYPFKNLDYMIFKMFFKKKNSLTEIAQRYV